MTITNKETNNFKGKTLLSGYMEIKNLQNQDVIRLSVNSQPLINWGKHFLFAEIRVSFLHFLSMYHLTNVAVWRFWVEINAFTSKVVSKQNRLLQYHYLIGHTIQYLWNSVMTSRLQKALLCLFLSNQEPLWTVTGNTLLPWDRSVDFYPAIFKAFLTKHEI